MTTAEQAVAAPGRPVGADATANLWLHFSGWPPAATPAAGDRPGSRRAEVFDDRGRRHLDGLSGLFVVQAGHGRRVLAETTARQAEELAFFPPWSYAHPAAIQLAPPLVCGGVEFDGMKQILRSVLTEAWTRLWSSP